LTFKTRYELCMSFVRMQEFYESPSNKFRGKYFTLEEYMDYWSIKYGKGSFTYPSVWGGFNISSEVYYRWKNIFISTFRYREHELDYEIYNLIKKDYNDSNFYGKKFYIIGVYKQEDDGTIAHETAHALYHLYPQYKKSCKKLLKSVPKKKLNADKKVLLGMGYCSSVLDDELQAYYSADKKNDLRCIQALPQFFNNLEGFKKSLK